MLNSILAVLSIVLILTTGASVAAQQRSYPLHTAQDIRGDAVLRRIDLHQQWDSATAEFGFKDASISDAENTIPLNQIVRWGSWAGPGNHQAVWLSDGSWICGEFSIEGQLVRIVTDLLDPATVPLREVRAIVVNPPASPNQWLDLLGQLHERSGDDDVVWLNDRRRITGLVELDADAAALSLDNGTRSVEIELSQTQAVLFSPALAGPLLKAAGELQLALTGGQLLNVKALRHKADRVEIQLAGGTMLTSLDPLAYFTRSVEMIYGRPSGVTFLADVDPASYKTIQSDLLQWSLGRDLDVWQRPLAIVPNGMTLQTVPGGLAMHSHAQVAYRLEPRPTRLLTELSLALPKSNAIEFPNQVVCKVLTASGGSVSVAAQYQLSAWGRQPVLVDLELGTTNLLALVVEPGSDGPYADHVLWLDARLVSAEPKASGR